MGKDEEIVHEQKFLPSLLVVIIIHLLVIGRLVITIYGLRVFVRIVVIFRIIDLLSLGHSENIT